MKEYKGPQLTLRGMRNISEEVQSMWSDMYEEAKVAKDDLYEQAKLSSEEQSKNEEIEAHINNYYYQKIRDYEVADQAIEKLSSPIYTVLSEEQKGSTHSYPLPVLTEVGGFYKRRTNTIVIDSSQEIFDRMFALAHEKSHASTSGIAVGYLENGNDMEITKLLEVGGMMVIGNQTEKAKIFEEALANMDTVAITNTILKTSLSEHYQERLDLFNDGTYDEMVNSIDKNLYGAITPEMAVPYIVINRQQSPNTGSSINSRLSLSIKEYLFARKVCETVGRTLSEDLDEESDTERAIQSGFAVLDRDRYLRTNDAHRRIVHTFGGSKTKQLFSLPPHPQDMDSVMKLLLE